MSVYGGNMFNKYVWGLYLKAGGQETVDFFRNNICGVLSEEYIRRICELQIKYCVSERIINETDSQLKDLYIGFKEQADNLGTCEAEEMSDKELEEYFYDIYENDLKKLTPDTLPDKEIFSAFTEHIVYLSTLWACETQGLFIPYYFFGNYNVVTIIAETFDIELPSLPKKADYKGRVWHYLRLCIAFNRFRRDNDLSPFELCAFLYDFAPNDISAVCASAKASV